MKEREREREREREKTNEYLASHVCKIVPIQCFVVIDSCETSLSEVTLR
jgi:hypothetical protein